MACAQSVSQTLVVSNSTWRFFRGTSEASTPPTDWRTNTFDDSTWEIGAAPFYHGPNYAASFPSVGTHLTDMVSNYTCIFLRQTFVLSNAAQYIALTNRPWADNGHITWINGIEVRRVNVGGGFVPYNGFAASGTFFSVPAGINAFTNTLRVGTNVLATQYFNVNTNDADSADFFANPELTAGVADTTPPVVQSIAPAPFSVNTNLIEITVTFSESVTNVRQTNLVINGAPATSLISNSPASYAFRFPLPPEGAVNASWNAATAIKDTSGNLFNATNVWVFNNVIDAPRVISATPPMNSTVSNQLTQITVVFNRNVSGLQLDDFYVNGQVPTTVSGSNTTYVFTFPSVVGNVAITWDVNHVIIDAAGVRMNEANNTWNYFALDGTPPAIASLTPASNSTVGSFTQLEVLFNEPVLGVDAGDLLINGVAATSAFGSGAGPYLFQFPQPPNGTVTVAWKAGHNIRDASTNAFGGGSWTVTLNPALFEGDIVINEFAAGNYLQQGALDYSEFNVPEDWIELYNRGTNNVRLLGWSLSNDDNEPGLWTFPDITLTNKQYLVVYASSLDRKVLGGTNRLHTNFKLNPFGNYLALFNAQSPRVAVSEFTPEYPEQRNDYSYGLVASNVWRYFATPTPGATNGNSTITQVLRKVKVNVSRGYFENPFTLVASCDEPAATLRYTTDGSEPTLVNGVTYGGPFVISNTTALRIAAFLTNTLPSRVATHTYIFLSKVLVQPDAPAGYPVGATVWAGYPSDYEMDPEIVTNVLYASQMKDAFKSLPVVCLTMRIGDLFDPTTGIYTHPLSRGPAWERPVSMEFFAPDGSEEELQEDAAIQIQGNAARDPSKQPKHPFKVQFKGDYGPSNLKYKMFHDSPRDEFDSVNLRADFNFSWLHWDGANQRPLGQRTRDSWGKDTVRAMGDIASHNRYTHLFINGLYWGVYDPTERPDGSFAAAYLGGEKSDYDVMNEGAAIDGTITAYNTMTGLRGLTNIVQYDAMKQYLDMTQFIDYMAYHFFVGHEDWGLNKNWYAFRRRFGADGFRYVPWDQENILGVSVSQNRVSNTDVPSTLHTNLLQSAQYRSDFADRVHRHWFNNGALMPTNNIARWMKRAKEVDLAIICESARWGDNRRDVQTVSPATGPFVLFTRNNQWLAEQTRLTGTYFPQRSDIVLAQFRAAQLYPNNTAPVFNQHGGRVPAGFGLTMTATNSIYYTLNGVDPRVYGTGALSPVAQLYTGPVSVGQSMVVKARMLSGTNWSALNEASFVVGSLTPTLRITEIMYNPVGGDAYEYLELQNTGPLALDIGNYNFNVAAINFSFPFGFNIAAGQRIVLGNNLSTNAWKLRYPGVAVAGWFGGSLANGGEPIILFDGLGRTVLSVTYDDEDGWTTLADGGGYSLEIVNPDGDPDDPANWRASNNQGGTPGAANSTPPSPSVVINEIMADNISAVNNGGTFPDWIEFFNTTGSPIDLTGWSLTDDGSPRKFVFSGTTIPGNGYLVVWADSTTNTTPGIHTGIALGRNGDSVFLYNANTNLVDAISFGPQVPNLTIGRIGGGWTLTTPTTNAVNLAATLASPSNLSINEWLVNSAPGFDDWLELHNTANNPVALRNLYLGTSNATFQIRSLSFVPPRGFVQLIADERAGADHLDFKLSNPGAIILYDNTGAELQRVTYGAQTEGVTQGRLPDGTATIVSFPGSASPAASNYVSNYTGPRINEVLARNSSAVAGPWGNYADYLEIYNPGTNIVSLAGMGLSDEMDNVKFTFPLGTLIASNGYLVVWCDGSRPASTLGNLNSGFSLSGSSGGAYLFNTLAQPVNWVEYGFQVSDLPIGVSGGQWRLLVAATPGATNAAPATLGSATNLRINEWMAAVPDGGNDWFELYNLDPLPVSMTGLFLTDDPSLAGLSNTPIAALSFIGGKDWVKWIADEDPSQGRDHARFDLDKDADSIRLYAADFSIIDSVSFGSQLEGVSQGRLPDGAANIVSFPATPTPDASNYLPLSNVVINEVLTHTDPPLEDAIEIQNTAGTNVNIGGWWISNSQRDFKKFRVPSGLSLAPGEFKVFYETNFNAGTGTNFTLNSAHGDAVYLSEVDGAGNLTGYRAIVEFGAAANGVSFGRFATSTGVDFTAMAQRTFGVDNPANVIAFRNGTGLTNSYPKVGPIVFNEIMYHPVSGSNATELAEEEFVELYNVTAEPVPMYDTNNPANGWRLSGGVNFNFSSSDTIPANGYLVIVGFNPATNSAALVNFRAKYGTNGTVLGPFSGRLDNGGEALELYRPDAPQQPPHPDVGFVPMILVDRVVYDDIAPWPTAPDGGGASLQRIAPLLYGNEVLNWTDDPPTAGAANGEGALVPPTISGQPQSTNVAQGATAQFSVNAGGTAPLGYQWQHAGTNLPNATNLTLTIVNVQPADAGSYRVLVSNLAGSIASQAASLTVAGVPTISVQPQSRAALAGSTVQFTVTANGAPTLFYQWRFNGGDLIGQNGAQLTLGNVQPGNQGNYTVVITNNAGSITSAVAVLTIGVVPAITGDPADAAVLENDPATFTVSATGTAPLFYQWRKDGINIPGANSLSYVIPSAQISDEGMYSVFVTNEVGSATSLAALLRVNTKPFLANSHVRGDRAFEFTLLGRSNRNYTVEFSTDFVGWTNVTNITLTGPQATVTDGGATNASSRFYRVKLNP
jgi:hypothetical protein